MDNGYIILGIISLLFLSIYGFSYLSVAREKMAMKRDKNIQLQKDALRRERRLKHQAVIDEKVRKFSVRKEEIQKELRLLEQMKVQQKVS